MKVSRDWATPLAIGSFLLMAVTGVLMFFHLDTGFNKFAHEWLSWAMLVGVALHASVNWAAFKRHLLANRTGQGLVVVAVVITAASFWPAPGTERAASPPMLALRGVMAAPVKDVATLTGRSTDELLAVLRGGGFPQATPDTRLDELARADRGREAAILNLTFKRPLEPGPAPLRP